MTDVTKLAAKIVDTVSFADYFAESFDRYHLEGFDGRRRHSLVARCGFDDTANLFATVPTVTHNVYLTISDGPGSTIRRVLATLEDMEAEGGVRPGNVTLFDDPALAERGYCGVLLVLPVVFNALEHVPATIAVENVEYRLMAVLFLTPEEHLLWRDQGHDALMDRFAATHRDIIHFGAPGSPGPA